MNEACDDPDRIPKEGAIRGEMDVGLDDRGVDAELVCVLETEVHGRLDNGVVDGANGLGCHPVEGPIEGLVARYRTRSEVREDAQRVTVGDAFPELAQIPVLDAAEDEGTEDAGGSHPIPPGGGMSEAANEILMDSIHEILLGIDEIRDGLQGSIEDDALSTEFGLGEADLRVWLASHGTHRNSAVCHTMSSMRVTPKKTQLSQSSGRYESLKRELASLATQMGFLLPGSVQSRFFECSRDSNCRCHDDPANRHGPYHYWTRKVKGKTLSVSLDDEQLSLVEQWIENSRGLERLLKQMRHESIRAIALITGKTVEQTAPARRR